MKLYTSLACNFCHRNRVTFHAKGVDVDLVEIDLLRRPPWFAEKASGGRVPLLECEHGPIFGSATINEYIEDRWPEPPMLPAAAGERAAERMWINWWNAVPTPQYEELLMNVRPERDEELRKTLDATLRLCEHKLEEHGYDGGYWTAGRLGLADASAAPVFDRFVGLRELQGFDIPEECGRVRAWRDTLLEDPHVRATSAGDESLLETLRDYRKVLTKAAQAGIHPPVSGAD